MLNVDLVPVPASYEAKSIFVAHAPALLHSLFPLNS